LQNRNISGLEKHSDISPQLSGQIHDGINYVCDFNNCENIKKIFPKLYNEVYEKRKQELEQNINTYPYSIRELENYSGPSKWEVVNYITEKIKVKSHWNYGNNGDIVYLNASDSIYPLDVREYDTVVEYNSYDAAENY